MAETWSELCVLLSHYFEMEIDLNSVLLLVGMRERGLAFQPFSREEKLNLINLGSCTLFLEMGVLERSGEDKEGWPLFRQKALAPAIPEAIKIKTLQECAIRYFKKVYP